MGHATKKLISDDCLKTKDDNGKIMTLYDVNIDGYNEYAVWAYDDAQARKLAWETEFTPKEFKNHCDDVKWFNHLEQITLVVPAEIMNCPVPQVIGTLR